MAGRPPKYCKEIVEQAQLYLKKYGNQGDKVPSIEGLSKYINIARSTIYKWAEEEGKEEFSNILEEIASEQGRILVNMGLANKFSPTITKLMLTKHGYSDKTQSELSGPNGKPIETKADVVVKFVGVGGEEVDGE